VTRPLQLVNAGADAPAGAHLGAQVGGLGGRAGLGETAWVDKAIAHVTDSLRAYGIDSAWLPRTLPADRAVRPGSVEELGCGVYGCVMPTRQEGLALKITTDESEAWFAHVALQLAAHDGWPLGLVRYRLVLGLRDEKRDKAPLYLLWRDEATLVGGVRELDSGLDRYMEIVNFFYAAMPDGSPFKASGIEVLKLARGGALAQARAFVEAHAARGDQPLSIAHQAHFLERPVAAAATILCLYLQAAAVEKTAPEAGSAIRYYLDQGLLLSDLHPGNVGYSWPDAARVVITDPGLVVPLRAPWFSRFGRLPAQLLVRS
jgi:hypothetical protein